MKYFSLLLLVFILSAPIEAYTAKRIRAKAVAAKCTGSTPCRACKNCRYCKHCAKDGGTCGVCRRRKETKRDWSDAAAAATHH